MKDSWCLIDWVIAGNQIAEGISRKTRRAHPFFPWQRSMMHSGRTGIEEQSLPSTSTGGDTWRTWHLTAWLSMPNFQRLVTPEVTPEVAPLSTRGISRQWIIIRFRKVATFVQDPPRFFHKPPGFRKKVPPFDDNCAHRRKRLHFPDVYPRCPYEYPSGTTSKVWPQVRPQVRPTRRKTILVISGLSARCARCHLLSGFSTKLMNKFQQNRWGKQSLTSLYVATEAAMEA